MAKKNTGVGDTIEQITELTGIKALVEKLFGENCGCDERKKRLNLMFPYKVNDLTPDEFMYLNTFNFKQNTLSQNEQENLLRIFNRVFNQNNQMTSCSACWRSILDNLKKLYNEYESD